MKKNQFSLQNETEAMRKIAEEIEKLPQESRERIVKWLLSIVGNIGQMNSAQIPETNVSEQTSIIGPAYQRGENVKEFFHSKQPRNNYQKLAVLGYFLEFMKGKDEFDAQDLKIAWKQTREALPSAQVFTNALNAALTTYNYFVRGEKRGLYRMGIKGQQLVETLPEEPKHSPGIKVKKGKRT